MVGEQECLFCKIIKGEIPSQKIYEDEHVFAFLDINPAAEGHALVAPKKHAENIFDIDVDSFNKTADVTKKLAGVIKEKLNPDGINILQNNGRHAGQVVDHLHFHIIPRYPEDKVVIMFPREQKQPDDLKEVAKKLATDSASSATAEKDTKDIKDVELDF
jgi:histidine triad (HIT) family protein